MQEKYENEYTLTCFDVDYEDKMRATSFLEYAQSMAEIASEGNNYGYKDLLKLGVSWVVIRMHTIFYKDAFIGDLVKISTWHRASVGPFFIRDYEMRNAEGELIASSTSSWVIMDLETRSLSRDYNLGGLASKDILLDKKAISSLCTKIVMPKENLSLLDVHKVVWSDIDHNNHANNVKYLSWAIDALPIEFVKNHRLKEVFVNFNKEASASDIVRLYYCKLDNAYFIEGKVDSSLIFVTKLIFEEK